MWKITVCFSIDPSFASLFRYSLSWHIQMYTLVQFFSCQILCQVHFSIPERKVVEQMLPDFCEVKKVACLSFSSSGANYIVAADQSLQADALTTGRGQYASGFQTYNCADLWPSISARKIIHFSWKNLPKKFMSPNSPCQIIVLVLCWMWTRHVILEWEYKKETWSKERIINLLCFRWQCRDWTFDCQLISSFWEIEARRIVLYWSFRPSSLQPTLASQRTLQQDFLSLSCERSVIYLCEFGDSI